MVVVTKDGGGDMKPGTFSTWKALAVGLIAQSLCMHASFALLVAEDFAADYSVVSLGSVPGLPIRYGGLTFKLNDPDTLLIGGGANTVNGSIYEIGLVRDSEDHIIGFSGSATPMGDVGEYNDGGVAYGPNNVLFTTQYPTNQLGQTLPGTLNEQRIDDLSPFGVTGKSVGAVNFVPVGFANAGAMKLVTWGVGNWYEALLEPDGSGTFNIVDVTQIDVNKATAAVDWLPGGPEGFVYIGSENDGFEVDSMLVSEWTIGQVSAYEIDGNGDPILTTRRPFITDLNGAEGAAIDPITGDFLFSTFGGSDEVVAVRGFVVPAPVPIPAALVLFASAITLLFSRYAKRVGLL